MLFSSFYALGQETNCGNGIDDDGDGYVDCFDPDCSANTDCDDFFMGDEATCEATPTQFPKFKLKEAWVSANGTSATWTRVAIGDLDGNGIPEVVVTNRGKNTMTILSGSDGTTIQTINLNYRDNNNNEVGPEHGVALGDVDRDGRAEIFVSGRNNIIESYKYNNTSNRYEMNWRVNSNGKGRPFVLGLADFNEDGEAELYYKDEIRNSKTGDIIISGTNNWDQKIAMGPVAVDILPDNACTDCQGLELVSGGVIYSINLATNKRTEIKRIPNYYVKYHTWGENWSSASVADYNQDGYMDVIASGAKNNNGGPTTVFFWDVQNNVVKDYVVPGNNAQGTGRLNIADIDGDGKLNVTFVSGSKLFALDENFNPFWPQPLDIFEVSSGFTGTTVFDFNGDGAYEIVYRDEKNLYIISGLNDAGQPEPVKRVTKACPSRTSSEYPVVADVDGDGATEICVTCNYDNSVDASVGDGKPAEGHVRTYKSDGENWVPSRKVWNQHTYFNVNINDDLTIPREMQKHHIAFGDGDCDGGGGVNKPLNTFLNQSPFLNINGCPTYGAPDFTIVDNSLKVNAPTCPDENFTVSFEVRNDGDISVSGDVPVTFYEGDPLTSGSTRLNTEISKIRNLKPGEVFSVTDMKVTGSGAAFILYVSFNDLGTMIPPVKLPNGSILECEYGGNIASAAVNPLPFKLGTLKIKDHLSCDYVGEDDVAGNGAARAFVIDGADSLTVGYTFYWFLNDNLSTPIDTGAIVNSLPAGLYTIKAIHDEAMCSSTVQDELTIEQEFFEYELGIEIIDGNRICKNPQSPGLHDGELRAFIYELNANGDTVEISNPDYSFSWYPSRISIGDPDSVIFNTATATNLNSQTYYVFFQDNSTGCTLSNSETVPDSTTQVQISVAASNIKHITRCDQPNAGSITATVSAVDNLKITWYKFNATNSSVDEVKAKNGITISADGKTINGLAAGLYYVEAIQNGTKCASGRVEVEIEEQTALPQFKPSLSPNTACTDALANGSISLAPSTPEAANEPTGGYQVKWYYGSTTVGTPVEAAKINGNGLKALVHGTYTGRLTNLDSKCFKDTTIVIQQNKVIPELFLEKTVPNTICKEDQSTNILFTGSLALKLKSGTSEFTAASTSGLENFEVSWFLADGTTPVKDANGNPIRSLTLNNLANGTYWASVKDKRTGCTISSPESFTVADGTESPILKLTPTHLSSCSGTPNGKIVPSITKQDGSPITTGYTIKWYDETGTLLPAGQLDGNNAIKLGTGLYKAVTTLTATNCPATAEIEIEDKSVTPILTEVPNTRKNNTICDTGLTSPSPGAYNGSISLSLRFNGVPISLPNSSYTVSWYKDGSSSALSYTGLSANDLSGGTYKIVVENTVLKCKDEVEITLIDRQPVASPVITAVNQTSCDVSAPNGELSVQMKDANGNNLNNNDFRFSWTDASGVEKSTTSQATNLSAGNYTLTAISNLSGCTYTAAKLVTDQKVTPVVTLQATQIADCLNPGKIEASVNLGTTADYTFEWYDADGKQLTETGPILTTWAGTFSVIAQYTATKCRSVEKEETIDAPASGDFFKVENLNQKLPASCDDDGGRLKVWVDNGAIQDSVNYTFTWYAGRADNYPASYTTSPQATFSQAALTNLSANGATAYELKTGIYTVVVEHKLTNCKEIKEIFLPYENAHEVEVLSVTDENQCDPTTPNGSFHVQIKPLTLYGHTQDQYHYYVYEGTSTTGNPINGVDSDGDGILDGEPGKVAIAGSHPDGFVLDKLKPGFYTIKAVETFSGNNCAFASVVVEIKQLSKPPKIDLQTVKSNTFCDNSNNYGNGEITFTFGPAAGDFEATTYSYQVYHEDGTTPASDVNGNNLSGSTQAANTVVTHSDLLHGKYILEVRGNATNCSRRQPFEISQNPTVPELLVQNVSVSPQVYCSPDENGKIEITEVGFGTETFDATKYNFSWTYGGAAIGTNSPIITDLEAGTYTVEIERIANGVGMYCTLTKDITVELIENQFTVNFTQAPNTNCDVNSPNGDLSAVITIANELNGSRALATGSDFKWTDSNGAIVLQGPDEFKIENQPPGWYTLEITDATTSCTYTKSYEIKHTPMKPAVGNIKVTNQTFCKDNGKLEVEEVLFNSTTITSGNPEWTDYKFTWYKNGIAVTGVNGPILNNQGEGEYAVQVEKTSTPGQSCLSPKKYEHIKFEDPQLRLTLTGQPDDACDPAAANGQITASASYGNSNISSTDFSWSWYANTGTPYNLTADNLPGTPAELYLFNQEKAGSYTIVVTDNTTGCTISKSITLDNNRQDIYVKNVNVRNQDKCNPSGSIEVLDMNIGDLSEYTFYWYGANYNEATPGANLLKDANGDNITGPVLAAGLNAGQYPNMGAGTYYVVAVRGNFPPGAGCESPARRVVVEEAISYPGISLTSFEPVTSCVAANGALEVSVSWKDVNQPGTYEWFEGETTSGTGLPETSNTLSNKAAGFYTLKVTDPFSGCENTRTFEIEELQVIPVVNASATNITYCTEENGTLFASIPAFDNSRTFEFYWYNGNYDQQPTDVSTQVGTTQRGQKLEKVSAGNYTVFAVEVGGMGCISAPAKVTIQDATQIPQPTARMDAPVSNCDPLRPNGQASVHVGGNITNFNFSWYNGTAVNESNFISNEIVATKLASGTYTVVATHKVSGCQGTTQLEIAEALETIVLTDTDVQVENRINCEIANGSLSASVEGQTDGYEFFWFYGEQVNPARKISGNGPVLSRLTAGEYTVYARKLSSGCLSNPVTKTIEDQFTYPEFMVETVAAVCGEDNGSATLTILEGSVSSIEWYTNNEVIKDTYQISAPAGTYTVSVKSNNGCQTTKSFTVPVDIKVFNGITDNNDGENDFFQVDCLESFPNNKVKIFNRAGTLVFEIDNYNNADKIFKGIGNKGLYLQGNKLPVGTYFYVIDKKDGSNPTSGYLELLR